jgi:hypothetical protein
VEDSVHIVHGKRDTSEIQACLEMGDFSSEIYILIFRKRGNWTKRISEGMIQKREHNATNSILRGSKTYREIGPGVVTQAFNPWGGRSQENHSSRTGKKFVRHYLKH